MTTEQEMVSEAGRSRGRKPYPVADWEEALELPHAIEQHGIQGQIRRLTLFNKIRRSPGSSASRRRIAASAKYGLINGNYNSEFLELTESAHGVLRADPTEDRDVLTSHFKLAIEQFDIFNSIYDQLKNKRIPAEDVLRDSIETRSINANDCEQVASILLANVRYLGLVQDQAGGGEYVISLEQKLEELPISAQSTVDEPPTVDEPQIETVEVDPAQRLERTAIAPTLVNAPTVHIDVQIHIDSNAGPDQIDQIFASMAKHLNI